MTKDRNKLIIAVIIVIALIIIFFNFFYKENDEGVQDFSNMNDIVVKNTKEEKKTNIIIHISGEVKHNGIIQIDEGSRIADVIEKAGGLTENADLSRVNLAYEVKDAQKIYIPSVEDEVIQSVVQDNGDGIIIDGNYQLDIGLKININSATVSELASLDGIGVSLAKRIVDYRNENGRFTSIDELKNVSGIGDSKYNQIKDKICI